MQHNESSIKIYHSKDYSLFRMINGNRQLDERKIKRIIKDISDGLDVLRYCPILVKVNGDQLDIIDGQHRYYVSRKLKCGVWYIIAEDMSLLEIAKINSNTEKWKDKDFINCYVQLGNKHYQQLDEFINEYNFPIGISIILLTKGYSSGEGGGTAGFKHKFRTGEFEVKELVYAHALAKQVKKFSVFPAHTSGGFIEAISRIIRSNKITINDLHKKFEKDPQKLINCKNAKEYLVVLEQIYNTGNRIRQIIF